MTQPADESAPKSFEDRSGEDLPLVELENIFNRPPSSRKRLMQLGLVLLAAIVALALFWGNLAPRQPAPAVSAPTPNRLPPMLLIDSNVNYGTVTINGKKLPGGGSHDLMLPVRSSTYTISVDAPPFRPVSCSVRLADLKPSAPLSDGEHCLSVAAAQNSSPGTPTYQISLFVTPNDLPTDQQSQVTDLLTQALTTRQSTTVPAGSYYATSYLPVNSVTSRRASVPLRGSATIAPFALQDPQIGVPCIGFICPGSFLSGDAYTFTGPEWAVTVTLALRWRFTTASGKVVSDVLFQGDNPYTEVVTFAILFLALDAAGDWTIVQNPAMPSAASQLQGSFCGIGDSILQGAAPPGQNGSVTTLRDLGVGGCEWLEQVNGIDQGTFLWRFGVLLAADARTHAAYPQLPLAPPQEIAAVEQP